ncbi:MAG: DUF3187 family protein [Gammaproteobacteria bacterium]|nr:DUF3187 family protein [Gammaproteobacteria bacterium]
MIYRSARHAMGRRCPHRAFHRRTCGTLGAWFGAGLAACSGASFAGDVVQPFLTSNQNPFIQIYSVPSPPPARLLAPERWRLALQFDLTNNSIAEDDAAESVTLDGETYRGSLSLAYGLSEWWEAGIVIPYVMQRRGVFDHFIEQWHDTFGLSNRKRTAFTRDQLNFSYAGNSDSQQLDEPVEGLGDIRLTLSHPLYEDDVAGRAASVQAGLKLPSGDAAGLLGSGGTDLSLQVSAIDAALLSAWKATLFWSAGMLWLGDGDVLDPIRRDYVAIGALGLGRPVTERIALKVQLDAHSSFYDTDLQALGANTVQLTVGGEIRLPGGDRLDLGLVENLFTDTTPDLVFHLAWRSIL